LWRVHIWMFFCMIRIRFTVPLLVDAQQQLWSDIHYVLAFISIQIFELLCLQVCWLEHVQVGRYPLTRAVASPFQSICPVNGKVFKFYPNDTETRHRRLTLYRRRILGPLLHAIVLLSHNTRCCIVRECMTSMQIEQTTFLSALFLSMNHLFSLISIWHLTAEGMDVWLARLTECPW
jgi:hypothetical protein